MNPVSDILARAVVPEHSAPFMQAVSGGRVLVADHFVFYAAEDWLMAIAYPLEGSGPYSHERFEAALADALEQTGATACFAVGPDLPPRLSGNVLERDVFYTLPAEAPVPPRLRSPVRKARERLRIDETRDFGPQHRRLWAEFMGRAVLRANVRELFARTPQMLAAEGADVRLLNAWDGDRLVACLVLDYSTPAFVSYIVGARSRTHPVSHAGDALFAVMLEKARAAGAAFVQLGLGVNEGITRFKRKWGAVPSLPYVMAQWQETSRAGADKVMLDELMDALLKYANDDFAKYEFLHSLPEQRPYAMLWELEKEGRRSWLCGTAHFFCYSFSRSFRKLFSQVDTVIFEGPLDEESMALVEARGQQRDPDAAPLDSLMSEAEIRKLERVVCGPRGTFAHLMNMEWPDAPDVRARLRDTRHWYAFFSLWTAFLERQGWRGSVDLEAWRLARDMGKTVLGMESIEEQIRSLELIPVPRVLGFFRRCDQWRAYMKRNILHYLRGDLEQMMGTSTEFPTRTEQVIDSRDQRFRERMRPHIERGGAAVFVGAAHILRLRRMLTEDGFTVRHVRPTWMHRLRARLRGEEDLYRIPDDSTRPY